MPAGSHFGLASLNLEEQTAIADLILFLHETTDQDAYTRLFGDRSLPGTFSLSEIKGKPSFFYSLHDNEGYGHWLHDAVEKDLSEIAACTSVPFSGELMESLTDETERVLDFKTPSGEFLCAQVPYQIYTDIIRRISSLLLTGNPTNIFHAYRHKNEFAKKVCMEVLHRTANQNLDLFSRLRRTILAGLVGLNLKDAAAATSPIVGANTIPLFPSDGFEKNVTRVVSELNTRTKNGLAIDCSQDFGHDVLPSSERIEICYLTDDCAETVFDLDLIQEMLGFNPKLRVTLIPRRYNFSNDASFSDVQDLLSDPYFARLTELRRECRLTVDPCGPLLSAIDPRGISKHLSDLLLRCDLLVVKGARAYEMLQGVRKNTYYAFAVAREFSESVTGLNAQKGEPVLIKQDSGERTFDDFRARSWRRLSFPDGRVIGLARRTALEHCWSRQSAAPPGGANWLPFTGDISSELARRGLSESETQREATPAPSADLDGPHEDSS